MTSRAPSFESVVVLIAVYWAAVMLVHDHEPDEPLICVRKPSLESVVVLLSTKSASVMFVHEAVPPLLSLGRQPSESPATVLFER